MLPTYEMMVNLLQFCNIFEPYLPEKGDIFTLLFAKTGNVHHWRKAESLGRGIDMALLDDMLTGSIPGVLIGIGVALAAPVVLPTAAAGARPLAKALIKGGFVVVDTVREVVAEAGEQLSDIMAEVQDERTSARAEQQAGTGGSRIVTPNEL
jgi:hypothetical protein